MTLAPELSRDLSRLEEARRQTQRQLDLVDRQITRRMTALIPGLLPRRSHHRRGKAPDATAFLASYRAQLAALTAERQPEIDALSRTLGGRSRRSPDSSMPTAKPQIANRSSKAVVGRVVGRR